MQRGVRQGCPISPLLFAASVDVLLRILDTRIPGGIFKAFADDIGAVLPVWDVDGRVAERIFEEFKEMSGLELNIEKTVGIPLWEENLGDITQTLRNSPRPWNNMCIADRGTYLGFVVGPGRGDTCWEKPVKKYSGRCKIWGSSGTGLQFSTLAYNTFAASTLGYVAQLAVPPEEVLANEAMGLKCMLPGPNKWVEPEDAFHLKSLYGQKHSFHSLRASAQAAKLRVAFNHGCDLRARNATQLKYNNQTVKSINCMAENIRNSFCDNLPRFNKWQKWYLSSFALVLEQNEEDLKSRMHITTQGTRGHISGTPGPWDPEQVAVQKKKFQKTVNKWILEFDRPDPVDRLRHKLYRYSELHDQVEVGWGIPGWPAEYTPRVLSNLQRLQKLAPPRVCAAAFRTIFNGWNTERRWQRRGGRANLCLLGCGAGAEDSLEHYCRCPVVLKLLRLKLNIVVQPGRALSFWCLDVPRSDDDVLLCSALSNYVCYCTTNIYRHGTPHRNADRSFDSLKQMLIQSSAGHPKVGCFLGSRWAAPTLTFN